MNEIITSDNYKLFENNEFGKVRVILANDEPWFVAADVCKALEIGNPSDALRRLDADERTLVSIEGASNGLPVNVVNEPGLYVLILGSRKPEAKTFKRWITHEVIPSIRKHGIYATEELTQKMIADPDFAISLLQELKKEREEKNSLKNTVAIQAQQIAELQPKANYTDLVLSCQDAVNISVIAKDYGWSAQKMNEYLYQKGIQYKQSGIWLLYQKYASGGYTKTNTSVSKDNNGKEHTHVHTRWTQKGRLFIYDELKKDDILPLIEQAS